MHCAASGSSAPGSSEVPEMAEPSKTEQRKAEHVNIILNENVSAEYNYWNDIRLVHNALPEIDLDDIDLGVKFFGKRLQAPLIISSMTGGFGMGQAGLRLGRRKEGGRHDSRGRAHRPSQLLTRGRPAGGGPEGERMSRRDSQPRRDISGHGEGDRRRDLAGDGDAPQAGGRPSDRRGWTRRDLVLRGRTLPGAEGGL